MFTVIFKNASQKTLGRGQGTIPATALVEALATLGGWNPLVSRAVHAEWSMHMLDTCVSVGAKFIAEHGMDEYPVELLDEKVWITIQAAA